MAEPMSDERLAEIRTELDQPSQSALEFDAKEMARKLLAEVDRLRGMLGHATELTFRPDFGDLNDEFSDDPEGHDTIVLSWRGSSIEGGDSDRWAVLYHGHWCWSRSKREFVYEPRPSERSGNFFTEHRFTLAEAIALVPEILREIEARRIPELRRAVEARTERKAGRR